MHQKVQKIFHIFTITTISLVVIFTFYSTVVEPSLITTEHIHISTGIPKKIALISDVHMGVYKWPEFLETIVQAINRANPDYVFIAGDLTLFLKKPSKEELIEYFRALKKLKAPTYAILGNHDLQRPGPFLAPELVDVLTSLGVKVLNNDIVKLDGFSLAGLWELWRDDADTSLFSQLKKDEKSIALIHNPDITTLYHEDRIPTLTLAGHVHGGQVRIPWLYKHFIPSIGDFDRGYYEVPVGAKKALLFISQGIGETGLPARFLCPPTVYIIDLK